MATPYVSGRTTTRGQIVQVDDMTMYYEVYGCGKPLVLLHGFGGCSQNWHPFVAQLSQHHRLILVDLRGHSYSTNPQNRFTHRQAASGVLHLLDNLGIGQFSAMGVSSGGMTLLHMATAEPQRIDTMVLISATSFFPDEARAIMGKALFATMPKPVQTMYRECAKHGEDQIRQLVAQFNAFHENYQDMNFSAQDLWTITARTLIVHGDRDRFFPVEIPIMIYRAIPNAALWIVPGGDHVPIYDATVPFTATALRFLKDPGCNHR